MPEQKLLDALNIYKKAYDKNERKKKKLLKNRKSIKTLQKNQTNLDDLKKALLQEISKNGSDVTNLLICFYQSRREQNKEEGSSSVPEEQDDLALSAFLENFIVENLDILKNLFSFNALNEKFYLENTENEKVLEFFYNYLLKEEDKQEDKQAVVLFTGNEYFKEREKIFRSCALRYFLDKNTKADFFDLVDTSKVKDFQGDFVQEIEKKEKELFQISEEQKRKLEKLNNEIPLFKELHENSLEELKSKIEKLNLEIKEMRNLKTASIAFSELKENLEKNPLGRIKKRGSSELEPKKQSKEKKLQNFLLTAEKKMTSSQFMQFLSKVLNEGQDKKKLIQDLFASEAVFWENYFVSQYNLERTQLHSEQASTPICQFILENSDNEIIKRALVTIIYTYSDEKWPSLLKEPEQTTDKNTLDPKQITLITGKVVDLSEQFETMKNLFEKSEDVESTPKPPKPF